MIVMGAICARRAALATTSVPSADLMTCAVRRVSHVATKIGETNRAFRAATTTHGVSRAHSVVSAVMIRPAVAG